MAGQTPVPGKYACPACPDLSDLPGSPRAAVTELNERTPGRNLQAAGG